MSEKLFSEFPKISSQQWKQKIQFELDGKPYNHLIRHTADKIAIKPFYDISDVESSLLSDHPKSQYGFEYIFVNDQKQTEERLKHTKTQHTEAYWLIIQHLNIAVVPLLKSIDLEKVPVFIEFTFIPTSTLDELSAYLKNKNHQVKIGIDQIGKLVETGNWFKNLEQDFNLLQKISQRASDLPFAFLINAQTYGNAGATASQQIAYALGHAHEYLHFWNHHLPESRHPSFVIKLVQDSDFFTEIAKLKALRNLWNLISKEYNYTGPLQVIVAPSLRNKSREETNLNLHRSSLEVLSGIFGGADGVVGKPLSKTYLPQNQLPKNTLDYPSLIELKNNIDTQSNPIQGSYFLEELTRQLSTSALTIFKTIEKGGGLLSQLKLGKIQQKIKETQVEEAKTMAQGNKEFLHSSNKSTDRHKKRPFLPQDRKGQKTLIEPIFPKIVVE